MWTWHFRLVRGGLTDGENIIDRSKVIVHLTAYRLTNDKEIGGLGRVPEDRSSDEIVVDDLSNFSPVDIAQQVRLRIADVEDGGLTEIKLLSESVWETNPV